MKFSIIMPVLNGERFLDAAISSVVAQSYADWELIVMDGGSTDHSKEIAAQFATKDSRITAHTESDKGIYDAILNGFNRSDGEWLAWLNSDDLYAPWCLAAVNQFLETKRCDWVTGYPACWDANGVMRYAKPSGYFPQSLIARGWFHDELLGHIQQESTFFSRRLFNQLSPEEIEEIRSSRLAGDFLLWRAMAKREKLEVVPTVLGGFRRHGQNRSLRQIEIYRAEVRASKAYFAPTILKPIITIAYRMASAWAMVKAAGRSDAALSRDLKSIAE